MDASLEGKRARRVPRAYTSPLSPTIFLRRNAGKTIPLVAVIMLAVLLVAAIIALIDSIPYSIRTIYDYSKEMVGVTPRGDPTATPKFVNEIKKGSPVPIGRVMFCRASSAQVQSIVGKWPYAVLGLERPDIEYFLQRQGSRGLQGRLPEPGRPEIIVSRPVAKNLGLVIDDPKASHAQRAKSIVQRPENTDAYSPYPVKVVGIADTDRWLMVGSVEYMRANYFPPVDLALVFAKDRADQPKLDQWTLNHFKGRRAQIYAYSKVRKESDTMFDTLFKILNVVIGTLVIIITVMMAMLINIYQSQRLVEFGLLQAIGYTKRQILRRVLTETVLVVIGGWFLGLGMAVGALKVADIVLMSPKAFALEIFDAKAYLYTIPLPLCILIVAAGSVLLRFRRFDPVGVVERRLV
jgi:ABC-type lipoprotein release transport system permease subunit